MMSNILVTSPYRPFTLPNQFKAVFNGYIYCGTVDAVDPSVSQVQVYLANEDGSRTPVAQPLRTNAGGYLVYNGNPAKFVTDSNHSLLVLDSIGSQVWYAPDLAAIDPEGSIEFIFDELSKDDGASKIKFKRSFISSILYPLSDLLEHSTVNAVSEAGADPSGVNDSTAAIHAALSSGYDVYLGPGRFKISGLLYPHFDGQRLVGAGDDLTEIFNNSNSEPLWCYGDPFSANGARQWSGILDLKFTGNSNTLWGIFNPNAPLVDGSQNASGRYEGVSSSSDNFYYGRTTRVFSEWTIAARGSFASRVSVAGVGGGFSLHCSSWAARFSNIRLWNGLDGLRVSGASNANSFRDFYISGMSGVSLTEPSRPSSIPTSCTYENIIVQQSGKGDNNRAIELLKSQGSSIRGLYLERNNEKSAIGDVFIGVACVGLTIESVRHRAGSSGPSPIIIENQGNGTYINSVTYSDNVVNVVLNSGTDSRTRCAVGVVATDGGVASGGEIVDTSTNKKLIIVNTTNVPVQLGAPLFLAQEISRGLEIKQGLSSSKVLDLVSNGSINFIVDASSVGSGRTFKFSHNGSGGSEAGLIEINDSAYVYPSTANSGLIGTASKPFSGGFTQTAFTVTSDENHKTTAQEIMDVLLDAWSEVEFATYQFLDRVEAKGVGGARWHFGVVAQRVVEALERHELDWTQFAFICFDKWDASPATYDDDGNLMSEAVGAGQKFGIRYEEALVLEAALQRRSHQRLLARVEAMERN